MTRAVFRVGTAATLMTSAAEAAPFQSKLKIRVCPQPAKARIIGGH